MKQCELPRIYYKPATSQLQWDYQSQNAKKSEHLLENYKSCLKSNVLFLVNYCSWCKKVVFTGIDTSSLDQISSTESQ